jgi:hypothetical protein
VVCSKIKSGNLLILCRVIPTRERIDPSLLWCVASSTRYSSPRPSENMSSSCWFDAWEKRELSNKIQKTKDSKVLCSVRFSCSMRPQSLKVPSSTSTTRALCLWFRVTVFHGRRFARLAWLTSSFTEEARARACGNVKVTVGDGRWMFREQRVWFILGAKGGGMVLVLQTNRRSILTFPNWRFANHSVTVNIWLYVIP